MAMAYRPEVTTKVVGSKSRQLAVIPATYCELVEMLQAKYLAYMARPTSLLKHPVRW